MVQSGWYGEGGCDQKDRVARRAWSSDFVAVHNSPDKERMAPWCCAILGAAKRHFCQVRVEGEENCVVMLDDGR